MEQSPWYLIDDVDQLDSPALVVYPDRVRQNIRLLTEAIDDLIRLRPHVKTHKSQEASQLMLAAGIRKFKCATIAEAQMLAMAGAPDVLLAYQPVGAKQQRLIELMQAYPETAFACIVDNLTTARQLAEQADRAGLVVPVYIDLNVGMNRTGIEPEETVLNLYTKLHELAGVRPVGLHAYDGHIHNPDVAARRAECNLAFAPVQQLADALTALGFEPPVLVAGGSFTFPVHARCPAVECSPGTFIYWDNGYGTALAEQPFLHAALVITRVISLPGPTKLCVDLGHMSIAAESPLARRVSFLNAPNLRPVGQSEEHLVLDADEGHSYQVGDVLYGLPYHICPTCALYERAYTVENGQVSGEWLTIARDRTITI